MKSLSLYSSFFVLRGRIYEIKKILSLALSALLCVSVVGCSSQSKDDKVIKVGATLVPGGELLEELKPMIEEKGYDLEIVICNIHKFFKFIIYIFYIFITHQSPNI